MGECFLVHGSGFSQQHHKTFLEGDKVITLPIRYLDCEQKEPSPTLSTYVGMSLPNTVVLLILIPDRDGRSPGDPGQPNLISELQAS